jgi:hypothetical protein
MVTPIAIDIKTRFIKALHHAIECGYIRGRKTFCDNHNIDRRNFYKALDDPTSHIFDLAWLNYVVRDFDISAQWLLTGIGKMTTTPKETLQKRRNAPLS